MAYGNSKIPLWSIPLWIGAVYLIGKVGGAFNFVVILVLGLSFFSGLYLLCLRLKSISVRYSRGKRFVKWVSDISDRVLSLFERFLNLFPDKGPKHVDGDPEKMSRTEKWMWRILLAPITLFFGIALVVLGVETMAGKNYGLGGLLVAFSLVPFFLTWKILKGKTKTTIVRNLKHW